MDIRFDVQIVVVTGAGAMARAVAMSSNWAAAARW
jgi:hypothetical protein